MKFLFSVPIAFTLLFIPLISYAHCPLCTIGAGVAALGASWLGISSGPIGVFIGAFSIALGLWIAKLIKKKYLPYQREAITLISFLTTVLPLKTQLSEYSSFYLSIAGDYGTILNRTYLINWFLIGSVLGGLIILISPYVSRKVSKFRGGKLFPYQGVSITFLLLIIFATIFELWI